MKAPKRMKSMAEMLTAIRQELEPSARYGGLYGKYSLYALERLSVLLRKQSGERMPRDSWKDIFERAVRELEFLWIELDNRRRSTAPAEGETPQSAKAGMDALKSALEVCKGVCDRCDTEEMANRAAEEARRIALDQKMAAAKKPRKRGKVKEDAA